MSSGDFYASKEWVALKKKAYRRYGRRCMATGLTEKDGITLSVDHVKSRSKHAHLALKLSNMQILEIGLNKTKSNRADWDFRPLRWKAYYFSIRWIKRLLLVGFTVGASYSVLTPSAIKLINPVILSIELFFQSIDFLLIPIKESFALIISEFFRFIGL